MRSDPPKTKKIAHLDVDQKVPQIIRTSVYAPLPTTPPPTSRKQGMAN